MKKVKVIFDFYDKFHLSTLYKAGDEVEFDDDRADDIVSRGLGRLVKAKGKTDKTPDPGKGKETTDPENGNVNTDPGKENTPDTNGEGKTQTNDGVNDGAKTETETEEEKKKASERKAAEILAKVNKK